MSGLCFSPSVVLPALPINTFSFYSQQYSFALEQCEVRKHASQQSKLLANFTWKFLNGVGGSVHRYYTRGNGTHGS